MYHIIIGDDDPLFLQEAVMQLETRMNNKNLKKDIDYEISVFDDSKNLIDYLHKNKEACQLILIAVEYGCANGLEIMKELRKRDIKSSLIYVTSHRDYIYECFDTKPLYYMLKPVDWNKMGEVIFNDYQEQCQGNELILKLAGKHIKLSYDEIYVLEATSHKVSIWLKNTKMSWNGTLSAIEQSLPSDSFCRCHNSFLVNLSHVQEFDRKEIRMDNGASFPVSKRLYAKALRQYFAYLKN